MKTTRFVIEMDIDTEKLRKEYRDNQTSIESIILEELGWVTPSGMYPRSVIPKKDLLEIDGGVMYYPVPGIEEE